ncbi:hypothetical protein P9112_009079 [Eukaryota sp. TZLM1-RC]
MPSLVQQFDSADTLVCREQQYAKLSDAWDAYLSSDTGISVFLTGIPGTGKTALVNSMRRNFEKHSSALLWFNALTSRMFLDVTLRPGTVMIVDEIDRLGSNYFNKLKHILKVIQELNVFCIFISNDLLFHTNFSSFSPVCIKFPAYTTAEVIHIIEHRLNHLTSSDSLFDNKKACITALSKRGQGDIRKVLGILRKELIKVEKGGQVDVRNLIGKREIVNEIESLPPVMKCLCFAIYIASKGSSPCTVGKAATLFRQVSNRLKIADGISELTGYLVSLEQRGILSLKRVDSRKRRSKMKVNQSKIHDSSLIDCKIIEDDILALEDQDYSMFESIESTIDFDK